MLLQQLLGPSFCTTAFASPLKDMECQAKLRRVCDIVVYVVRFQGEKKGEVKCVCEIGYELMMVGHVGGRLGRGGGAREYWCVS